MKSSLDFDYIVLSLIMKHITNFQHSSILNYEWKNGLNNFYFILIFFDLYQTLRTKPKITRKVPRN